MDDAPLPPSESEAADSADSGESSRKSRARERHQRRKERKQAMVQPVGPQRQLRPTGGFKLPEMRLPLNRVVLYVGAGLAVLLIVVFGLGRLKNSGQSQQSTSAVWIGSDWTYAPKDDALVSGLVQRLADHRIGQAYAWVSLLQPDNTWSDTIEFNQVRAFAEQFKRLYPEGKIYGWLSIAAQGSDGNNRLGDPNIQQMVTDLSERIVGDYRFDGVVLNIVPVTNGDENFLALLRKVRAALAGNARLAVAVPPDWTPQGVGITVPARIAPGTVWDRAFKQRVALLADQMIVTAYGSGLENPTDYSAWVAYQVEAFTSAVADLETGTELLFGVPTYEADAMHDEAVENVTSAVTGIREGIARAGEGSRFIRGIAVYAEWQTTDDEWNQIRDQWSNRG